MSNRDACTACLRNACPALPERLLHAIAKGVAGVGRAPTEPLAPRALGWFEPAQTWRRQGLVLFIFLLATVQHGLAAHLQRKIKRGTAR